VFRRDDHNREKNRRERNRRKMKKAVIIAASAVMALGLSGCSSEGPKQDIDTMKYEVDDMNVTTESMYATLDAQGYVADKVVYRGDDLCDDEALEQLNSNCENDEPYTSCIGFKVDYHLSSNPLVLARRLLGGKDIDNEEKTQYFWFGKTDDGEWEKAYSGEIDIVVK
jgi:hypothetical protein